MMETIRNIDTWLLLLINGAHDSILDFIMYWISAKIIWIPFYIWLIYVLYRNYGIKTLWILPAVTLMIVCSDQSCNLIKNFVLRMRPCHEPALAGMLHLVRDTCGGTYGFVSSHAANTMALSVFVFLMLPRGYKDLRLELIGFVLLTAYSRIYLAVHYPLDVFGGWIIGIIMGVIFARLLQLKLKVPASMPAEHED